MRDPDTGNSRGFGFISYDSFDASDAAIEVCIYPLFLHIFFSAIVVAVLKIGLIDINTLNYASPTLNTPNYVYSHYTPNY